MQLIDVKQKNTLALAYLGDAVYESLVREYLMEHSNASPAVLHKLAVSVVCADAQCEVLELLKNRLNDEENAVVRRGRNASKAAVPKSATPKAYRAATALEALFGYLMMSKQSKRIHELFEVVIESQLEAALMKQVSVHKRGA